ncbi:PREDICTED: uncharacterized protein LOC108370922 isoform X1 [Rhagoletis zephyria]|uniref:uncharacterized protein LOC108370922 isoform X1 n=2 Tax=Rhagoletis zephyria TaxID=28612 RepID=UPI00081186BB|nr:PREDICTED: uncharacterized protein LOC108370922 isoform X1 [Rhagoletis zephyria]XP_017481863.1 PREDICTED: uncharacterized protein LOC108370922 isoform X1 [Rhagoletis zephyria]XP_017481871.1 PREDICTED: uncharacterized protein LOC108370922 isoform X1 [Rhagoletis zephyria]XP_017481879.1 PREDICTED: uncharacterized protein LOC108370922 isoform X1 [Rhagoletis zephyria]XP_017481886.1 PREDICTED: uncharacterized protein LOC108370922 isoform X1 [Rhagoletis zephyria]XP_017481894.1 PREDICTED: uncharact
MMSLFSRKPTVWSNGSRRSGCRGFNDNGIAFVIALYVVVAFVGNELVTSVRGEECGQEEFTKCAEPLEMLHLTSEFSIGPAKKDELDKLCNELKKGVRCIQSYTRRCMPLQQRNQFNKLYHGTNQFIRDLCIKGEFQDEYLKHAPCSEMAKKEFEVCANRYKETMVFLKPNKNQESHENITLNENIKTICCSINELVDCSEDAARKICGPDAAKFTRELVDKYANSLTKLYCEDFTRHPEMCHDGLSDDGVPLHQSRFGRSPAIIISGIAVASLGSHYWSR